MALNDDGLHGIQLPAERERRAIVVVDVVESVRLMELDESAQIDRWRHFVEEAINEVLPPKIILAGSGMMTGGRILHHLVRYLPDPHSTLLIVGYQAAGTIGRRLYEGAKVVRIHKQDIHVNATVRSIGAWSAHADQAKLMRWVQEGEGKPEVILVTHGEENAADTLARKFRRDMNIDAYVPSPGPLFDLHA